jgi:predicted ribosomally synthesized peptide with nif11-like leader
VSVQAALQFIRRVRQDGQLADRVRALGPEATLDQLVSIGTEAGYDVTADDLRRAHAHDWSLRWIRYRMDHEPE